MSMTASSGLALNEQSIAVPTDVIWRFSVAQYHVMIQAGILTEDDPVELLEGWLVTKRDARAHGRQRSSTGFFAVITASVQLSAFSNQSNRETLKTPTFRELR